MSMKVLTYRFIKLFVFISVIVIIMISCKIGEDDNTTTTIVEDGYNLIGTQVIGPAGGEIDLDSIIVKVPSGAFNENTELSIYVGEENDGFDEYGSSALYQIDGLPSTINKPIRLSIKYHGTIEGDTLVAIGEMGYAVSLDSSLYSYHTENASDSAGYLVYDLPAYSGLAKSAQPESIFLGNAINFIGLNRYIKVPSSNGHFMLSYPLLNNPQGVLMGEHFETAYTTCQVMGFNLSARSWPTQPANVLVKTLRTGFNGFYTVYGKATMTDEILKNLINRGKFTINLNLFTDDLKLRTVCGHEFLHLVQNLYEFSSPSIEPEQSWLEEATAVWIEEKYSNLPYYVPHILKNREYNPFVGWQYTSTSRSHAEQGYGLSVIIKEIADTYGDDAIVEIFEKIKAGTLPNNAVDPVDAVLSVVDEYEPIDYFWHRVLRDYVLGKYYNNQVNFEFLDQPDTYTEILMIDAQNSTHSLKYNYPDLSGDLYKVIPGDLTSLDKVPLSFTINDPTNCGILVCKYKQGSEIDLIGEVYPGESGQVSLSDVKPIFDDGYELVVMVSNSKHDKNANYQGDNEVELTIEIKELWFNHIQFDVRCRVLFEETRTSGEDVSVDTYWHDGGGVSLYHDQFEGLINVQNNTVIRTANTTDQYGDTYQTNLSITFDDIYDPTIITSFSYSSIGTHTEGDDPWNSEESASGINISLNNDSNLQMSFEAVGNISSNLLDIKYKYIGDHTSGMFPYHVEKKYIDYDASDGRIWFGFDKDWTY